MVEHMKLDNGVLFWDVSFFRVVHAWELEALAGFMDTIYGASVKGFGEDKMCWKLDREKGFLVKDYNGLLVGPNDFCFPWKKYLETENSFSSSFLCLDCCFGEVLND